MRKETVWTAGSSFPSARAIDYVNDVVDDDVFVGPAARGHRAPNSPGRTVVDDASERSDFPAGFLYNFCRARRTLSLAALPLGSVASAVSHAARDVGAYYYEYLHATPRRGVSSSDGTGRFGQPGRQKAPGEKTLGKRRESTHLTRGHPPRPNFHADHHAQAHTPRTASAER